jgi:hypothetical protein
MFPGFYGEMPVFWNRYIPASGLPISGACLLIVPPVFLEGDLKEQRQPESDEK